MAFSPGTNAKVYVNGRDLSTYLRSADTSGSRDMLDSTTLGLNDRAFVGGLRTSTFNGEGFFDGTLDAIDQILATALDTADATILTYLPYGDALGNRGMGIDGDESQYDINSPVDGLVVTTFAVQSSVGSEPVVVLHPLAQRTATGNGTSVDQTAASTAGGAGYLQVTAHDRTTSDETLAVKVQHSADNVTFVDLITFTTVASATPQGQRVSVTGTVNRYVRAQYTLAGTTPISSFQVAFHRNS